MTVTARQLITKAYYLSGVVARKFQSVSGAQITDGLELLRELLAEQAITGKQIPYYGTDTFTAVPGQEIYFVPDVMDIETLTFVIDDVRYSMRDRGRVNYLGKSRANNVQSLPYEYHYERVLSGAGVSGVNIFLYFLPDQPYVFTLSGKFAFASPTLDTDLSLVLEVYYIKYLTYALASDICEDYQITFPPQALSKLKSLEEKLTFVSPIDLTVQKESSFQGNHYVNYGMVNLGRGWVP